MTQDEARQIFNGLMLGDGCLHLQKGRTNARFEIKLSGEEHIDWLNQVKEALKALGVVVSTKYPKVISRTRKDWSPYLAPMLASYSSPFLTVEYDRWYVREGKGRKVPPGFKLTELTLAHWFMGDGNSNLRGNSVAVNLASGRFGYEGNKILQDALERDLGIEMRLYKHKESRPNWKDTWQLRIGNRDTVNRIMDCIEPYIMPSYLYKIKRPLLA